MDFDLEAGGFTIVVILRWDYGLCGIGIPDTRVEAKDEVGPGCDRSISISMGTSMEDEDVY